MSWRIVVISRRSKLDLKLNYMVVRSEDTVRIHLSEISTVVIESTAVSLTAALLAELTHRKIKVIFCDERRNPSSELVGYYGSHDTSGKVRQQVAWSPELKKMIWTEIVSEKIRMQKNLLYDLHRDEYKMLEEYLLDILPGDESNREGHAAKVYFNALYGMGFTRTAEDSINAALNYGYGILLSAFNREIVAAGYVTQIGLFHNNQFNQFNLGSDLMEPFRPLIDRTVYEMQPEEFNHDEKMVMISVLNSQVTIDGRKHQVNNAIKIYCKSIFEALNDQDIAMIRFYRNEL